MGDVAKTVHIDHLMGLGETSSSVAGVVYYTRSQFVH